MGVWLPVPLLNQLREALPNQQDMCVPTALAAAVSYKTGRHVTGSDLQSQCVPPYGPAYRGFEDAANYVGLLSSLYGLRLVEAPLSLQTIRASLAAGNPVLLTIPSDWLDNPPHADTTHVVCANGDDGASITAMNPWNGVWLTESYAWWASRIRGVLWMVGGASKVVNTAGLGPGFAAVAEQEGSDAAITDTYIGSVAYGTLQNGAVMFWDGQSVHTDMAAHVVALLHDEVARLGALVTSLQQQVAPPAPSMGPGEVEWYAAGLAVAKALKASAQ